MSRNLCDTRCHWRNCNEVEATGLDHEITEQECAERKRRFDLLLERTTKEPA